MDYDKIKFLASVINEVPQKSDAIVCLQGDKFLRANKSFELLQKKYANIIIVSGGLKENSFSIPADKIANYLIKKGVNKNKIIIEYNSQNTSEQAREVFKIIKDKKYKSIILVASAFHQPRALLTFLKSMKDLKLKIKIFNAPTNDKWFKKIKAGLTRIDLLEQELEKIDIYFKKGDLVSIKEGILYQKSKESASP